MMMQARGPRLRRRDQAPRHVRLGDDRPEGRSLVKKVVLAYSGGLDTSVAVAWLREQYDAEVVTLTVDLGGGSLREGVAERAMSAGGRRRHLGDGRERVV